jgi:hypothetical protein
VAGLVLRWNGTAWSQVSLPGGGGCCTGFSTRKLHDLVAVASNDVWVVGTAFSFSVFAFVPYWVHWNGSAWTDGTLPSPSAGGFGTVTALSATKVYAFGGESAGPLIAKWNGSAWSRETAPSTPGNPVDSAVTGTGTVWAVGSQAGSGSNVQTFAIRTTNG